MSLGNTCWCSHSAFLPIPAAPGWILRMQRGEGGDQGVTQAGGQVTNLSVPFRGGLDQWGVHGGEKPPKQESEQSHQTLYCTIQVFKGKRLSPTVLGSGSAVGHPEPLFPSCDETQDAVQVLEKGHANTKSSVSQAVVTRDQKIFSLPPQAPKCFSTPSKTPHSKASHPSKCLYLTP